MSLIRDSTKQTSQPLDLIEINSKKFYSFKIFFRSPSDSIILLSSLLPSINVSSVIFDFIQPWSTAGDIHV